MTEKDYFVGGSNTRFVTRLGKVFNNIDSYHEYYWSQFTTEYKDYHDRSWWKKNKCRQDVGNRYNDAHNSEYSHLCNTYKGYSNALLQQALDELKEFGGKDVLEVPRAWQCPILNLDYSNRIAGSKVTLGHKPTTIYREVPVYVIRRFLKQMIDGKNERL